jgi:sugar/nucleoside kinase (ribokinase family)
MTGDAPPPGGESGGGGYALVVGDVSNDVVVRPFEPVTTDSDTRAEIVQRPGGSAANVACWLGSVGGRVRFVGRVGLDELDDHTSHLTGFGVAAHLVGDHTAGTGTVVIVVDDDGERTMYVDSAANLNLHPADVPGHLVQDALVMHLTGYSFFAPGPREAALALLARAHEQGVAVSVDPSSVAFLERVGAENFLRWTAPADLCFPNLDEACCLTGSADPEIATRRLTEHYRVVVVKLGADGCLVAGQGEAPVHVPADRVVAVDTTGAGDAFCAGFLEHWMRDPEPVAAARSGARLGRTAVLRLGARPPLD